MKNSVSSATDLGSDTGNATAGEREAALLAYGIRLGQQSAFIERGSNPDYDDIGFADIDIPEALNRFNRPA